MTGTPLAGRYELGPLLGRGGMARVHAARDVVLDRPVAVKVLAEDVVDQRGRERFVREARTAARFEHPNAIAVYDAGEADGVLYIVMELVEGRSLAERLAAEGPLPVDEAQRIIGRVLDALGAAHAVGVIHRDVKPGNVLLGAGGLVKLADFGIAKRLDQLDPDLTGTGQFVGTPRYLAPEQVVGDPVTPATDLYAAAVVLYEMLAGTPPFDAGTPLATAIAQRDETAPDVRDVRPDVPPALAAALVRAMAKRPQDRFPSAAAMRVGLGPVPADTAPEGPPPTRVMAVPPGRRRTWLPAAVLVGVAAVVLVMFLVGRDREPAAGVVAGPGASPAPTTMASGAPTTLAPAAPTTGTPATTVAAPATNATLATTATTAVVAAAPPVSGGTPASPPADLAGLIELVAADPGAWGAGSDEFLVDLRAVAERNGKRQADLAGEVLSRLEGWAREGRLDPAAAALARPVLASVATGPGDGGGNGEGDRDGD